MIPLLVLIMMSFSASATERALKHPEGTLGALQQFFLLNFDELEMARESPIKSAVLKVALDAESALDERVLAIRVLSLLKAEEAAPYLADLLVPNSDPAGTILARETAKSLYQMGATPVLSKGLAHPDPEVKVFAARSGAGGQILCTLLKSDPWPEVRAAAADGLVVVPSGYQCVLVGLADSDQRVVHAAIRTIGELRVTAAQPALERIVRKKNLAMNLRTGALRALTQMGEFSLARKILATHLKHGGMVSLCETAVSALAENRAAKDTYLSAIDSKSPRVRLALAKSLIHSTDSKDRERVEKIISSAPPEHRHSLRNLQHSKTEEDVSNEPHRDNPYN